MRNTDKEFSAGAVTESTGLQPARRIVPSKEVLRKPMVDRYVFVTSRYETLSAASFREHEDAGESGRDADKASDICADPECAATQLLQREETHERF